MTKPDGGDQLGEGRPALDSSSVSIRRASSDDLRFLATMLAEAAFPPALDPRPTPEEAVADERAGRYLRGWGRRGDLGLIAVGPDGAPRGAAWFRLFDAAEPGHGFVDESTPEVAIAIVSGARGRGVGTLLLGALLEAAGAAGFPRLSLSVSTHNPAGLALYRRAGFTRVGGGDELPVMVAPTCIFCRIVAGSAEASFVHRDPLVSAFMDIDPITPGHLLVIPNAHSARIADVPTDVAGHMFEVAIERAERLRRSSLTVEGINLFLADGEAAGQEVFHTHLHVLPRFVGDGFIVRPGRSARSSSRADLDRIAGELRGL